MKGIFPGLVTVYTDTDRIRIELVKTLLTAEGIFYQVAGEGFPGFMGLQSDVLGITKLRVQVHDSDAERARQILSKEIDGYEKNQYVKEK